MKDQNLLRGWLFVAIALAFGLESLRYPIGQPSRAGAGFYPLMMSAALLLIGVITIVRARFSSPVLLSGGLKNIALIMLSLAGLALLAHHLNFASGIIFMVFCAGFAGSSYSVVRNIKIAAGLIVVAWGFQSLLGLNLHLF